MNNSFQLTFGTRTVASALGVTDDAVVALFTDGRTATPIIQRRLAAQNLDWGLVDAGGGGLDLRAPDGGIWKVKSVTGEGIIFRPSVQIGFGRQANEHRFLAAWRRMAGFIVADVLTFPAVQVDRIPIANVVRWFENGGLTAEAKVTLRRYRDELRPDIQY